MLKPLRSKPKPAICALVVATFTQVESLETWLQLTPGWYLAVWPCQQLVLLTTAGRGLGLTGASLDAPKSELRRRAGLVLIAPPERAACAGAEEGAEGGISRHPPGGDAVPAQGCATGTPCLPGHAGWGGQAGPPAAGRSSRHEEGVCTHAARPKALTTSHQRPLLDARRVLRLQAQHVAGAGDYGVTGRAEQCCAAAEAV